jgi:hypothetical protein
MPGVSDSRDATNDGSGALAPRQQSLQLLLPDLVRGARASVA